MVGALLLLVGLTPAANAAIWSNQSSCITSSDTRWKAATELIAWDTGSTVRVGRGTKGLVYKTNCAGTASKIGSLSLTWTLTVYGRNISCSVSVPAGGSCGGTSSEREMNVLISAKASSLSSVVGTDSMYFKDSGDATKICSKVTGSDNNVSRVITEGCLGL